MALIYPEESNGILGIAMQLHREMGCGFKEKVYQDAFEVLLKENEIDYEREKHIELMLHGVKLEHDFFYDFLVFDKIGVEIKAVSEIVGEFESQLNQLPTCEQSQVRSIAELRCYQFGV